MTNKKLSQNCGNCQYWVQGDLSRNNIGNAGMCAALLPIDKIENSVGNIYRRGIPSWAENMSHRMLSFEGTWCNVFQSN